MGAHRRIQVEVWSDSDWLALDFRSQYVYRLLLESKTLSSCGVIPYVPTRFTRLGRDLWKPLSPRMISRAVEELSATRFVVVDHETAELLVRSYMRHDNTLRTYKMGQAVAKAVDKVVSEPVLDGVYRELRRIYDSRPDLGGWAGLKAERSAVFDRVISTPTVAELPFEEVDASPDESVDESADGSTDAWGYR